MGTGIYIAISYLVFGKSAMKLHLELTNRCVLECPGCPRTQWKNLVKRPVDKADLDIDELENFLNCENGKKVNTFLLCGDYGDPIYYPRLFEFIERFRDTKSFNIITNGSYRDQQFWNKLTSMLDQRDSIVFSIDGTENTNHIYRINSNWSSIMTGIDTVAASNVKLYWKTIIFNYNYNHLDEIRKLAESKNAVFVPEKTHRYGDDSLIPPADLIEHEYVYKQEYSTNHNIIIEPKCFNEKTVTCDGYLFPCDWIRNPRTLYKSQLWKQKNRWIDRLRISQINFDDACEVVNDWANYVKQSSLNQLDTVDVLCKMKCRSGCKS